MLITRIRTSSIDRYQDHQSYAGINKSRVSFSYCVGFLAVLIFLSIVEESSNKVRQSLNAKFGKNKLKDRKDRHLVTLDYDVRGAASCYGLGVL
jgi:hypothetical protein